MKLEWEGKIGPAAVLTVVGMVVQAAVVVWVGATIYTKTIDKIEAQGSKIEEVDKGSTDRFQAVYTSLAKTRDAQQVADQRLSRVETAISYISSQVQRVEAKLDGNNPAPALPPPPKP